MILHLPHQILVQLLLCCSTVSESVQAVFGSAGPGQENAAVSVLHRLAPRPFSRPSHRYQQRHHLPAALGELPVRIG